MYVDHRTTRSTTYRRQALGLIAAGVSALLSAGCLTGVEIVHQTLPLGFTRRTRFVLEPVRFDGPHSDAALATLSPNEREEWADFTANLSRGFEDSFFYWCDTLFGRVSVQRATSARPPDAFFIQPRVDAMHAPRDLFDLARAEIHVRIVDSQGVVVDEIRIAWGDGSGPAASKKFRMLGMDLGKRGGQYLSGRVHDE